MLKVLELFSGIGACSKALTNLGIEHEIVDAVEIDKYAVASFNAIHGTFFEPQDITKWNKDIDVDLVMHGSPCQDFSVAGKQAGGDEGSGTRSSLMHETVHIVGKLKPKYVIWENVKNLLSKKHRHNFDAYLERMSELGYKNYYQVLNAKDYGVPQNRERVFTVSIRLDVPYCWAFKFPARRPLTKRLKDVLETEVDEKYYLSDKQVASLVSSKYDQNKRFYDPMGVSPTLSTMQGGNRQPKIIDVEKVMDIPKEIINDNERQRRVYSANGASPTVLGRTDSPKIVEPRKDDITNATTSVQKDDYVATPVPENGVSRTVRASGRGSTDRHSWDIIKHDMRIRKLTAKECWRLMGFDDADFEKAAKVNSNTQLYKQAGNSIVVDVLEAILEELLCK